MDSATATGVPTPNRWLESKLRELGVSNSGLARLLSKSRTEVQRWVNSREQIPRHHLAEIAAQLGTPDDLEYAIRLKECEDFADNLRRKLRELARIGKCDAAVIEANTFTLLREKSRTECVATPDEYISVLLYNMTHASFVVRQWSAAAASRNFQSILDPDMLKLHIQYPANHFLGMILSIDAPGSDMAEFQAMTLGYLRRLAIRQDASGSHQLASQHAVHMLARFGHPADQAMVTELIEDASMSDEPLCRRLGYAGLIQRPEFHHLAEKYSWLLRHDEALASVDLLFEAVHYGDVALESDRTMPSKASNYEKSLASVVRRLEQPGQPDVIRNLETLRFFGLLDRIGPLPAGAPIAARIHAVLTGLAADNAAARKWLAT